MCAPHAISAHDIVFLAQAKKNAVFSKIMYHCSRGPEDNRSLEAAAAEPDPKKRIDRTALGLSIKVGCSVHFAVRTQPDTKDITEILYYNSEHSDACQVWHLPNSF